MTFRDLNKSPLLIEMTHDSVLAHFRDGALVADVDLATEKNGPTVDFFIKASDLPEDQFVVSAEDRFRRDAERWGPVRERLSDSSEKKQAQSRLETALVAAHEQINMFRSAVERDRVSLEKNGSSSEWRFFFKNEAGERFAFRVELGRGPLLRGLSLEDEDGTRVLLRDSRLLKPFETRLRPLLRKYQQLSTTK